MNEAPSPRPGEQKKEPVVLFVEDHFDVRVAVAECFRQAGFKVLEAVNAEEARALAGSGARIDAVISDIDLGDGQNGLSLAEWFAQSCPLLPVILTSARIDMDGMQSGQRHFLRKPYDIDDIVLLVRRVIR